MASRDFSKALLLLSFFWTSLDGWGVRSQAISLTDGLLAQIVSSNLRNFFNLLQEMVLRFCIFGSIQRVVEDVVPTSLDESKLYIGEDGNPMSPEDSKLQVVEDGKPTSLGESLVAESRSGSSAF